LFEHDLFGKPVSTFPDHALISDRGGIPIDVFRQTGKLPDGMWVRDQGVAPCRGRGRSGSQFGCKRLPMVSWIDRTVPILEGGREIIGGDMARHC
jgi:hypothetical protein